MDTPSISDLTQQELLAVTEDTWTEDDIKDEPSRDKMIADIHAKRLTSIVADEILDCLDRDWCLQSRKVRQAFLTDLARGGFLERYNPESVTMGTGKRRKITVDGVAYEW